MSNSKIKKIQITPSVTLTAIPSEKFKIAYLSIYFARPLCENEAAMNALIPEILTRSCKKYPTILSLSSALQSMYGASIDPINTLVGETHLFGIYSAFPENRYAFDGSDILSQVVSVISELILAPLTDSNGGFDKTVVESEKEKLCGRIRARINNPAAYAARRCQEIMCADERFSVSPIGTLESVSSVEARELYDYYKALPGSTEINIFYTGSEDPSILAEKFRDIFRDFDTAANADFSTEVRRNAPAQVKTVIEERAVTQGKLAMGFRSGFCLQDENYHVFVLMNSVLGASPTSKLFLNVREKMSLCYYCNARPNALKGIMIISSGIEVADYDRAYEAILHQVEAVKAGDISDFELENAKKSLINGYKELTDSTAGLATWYLKRSFAGRSDSPEDVAEKIKHVTKEEVVAAAQRLSLDTVYFLKGTLTSDPENGECGESGEDGN